MKKFEGIVVSTGMKNTIIVEVLRQTPHPLYKKLIKRSKKYKADNTDFKDILVGSTVRIVETRPISKNKYFKVSEVVGSKPIKVQKKEEIIEKTEEEKPVKRAIRKTAKPTAAKTRAGKENKIN